MTAARRLDLLAAAAFAVGVALSSCAQPLWRSVDPRTAVWDAVRAGKFEPLDPWGRTFRHLPGTSGPLSHDRWPVGVDGAYSVGPDGIDDRGTGDDVLLRPGGSYDATAEHVRPDFFRRIRGLCVAGCAMVGLGYLLARAPRSPSRALDVGLALAAAATWFFTAGGAMVFFALVLRLDGRHFVDQGAFRRLRGVDDRRRLLRRGVARPVGEPGARARARTHDLNPLAPLRHTVQLEASGMR